MSTLTYQEAILQQMQQRALRGVLLALVFSVCLHAGLSLIQLGGESFGFRPLAQEKSGDKQDNSSAKVEAFRAQIQPRATPAPTPEPAPVATPPTPVPTDRATVTMQTRELRPTREPSFVPTPEAVTVVPPSPLDLPAVKTDLPALPPSPTKQFDASTSPTRVERQAVTAVPQPSAIPPLYLKPLPPLDITPPKREQIEPKAAQTHAPAAQAPLPTVAEPSKAAAEPPSALATPSQPPAAAPPSQPPAAATLPQPPTTATSPLPTATNSAPPQITTAVPTPALSAPSAATVSTGASSPSAPAATASSGATSASGAPSAGSRGATVTLPGPASGGPTASGAAPSSGSSDALKPGFIDGFDADAARRNAARNAARDLNARRSLVPPSVAPSPTAREREAKAIEDAILPDCTETGKSLGLFNVPVIVAGVLVNKGCKIRTQ